MRALTEEQLLRIAIAAGLLVLALGLGNELQEYDPPQYADVAARMLRSGSWLALRDMNGPFINKPPFMMWAQAVTMAVTGVGSVGARFPAWLFAALTVWGTWLIGKTLFSSRTALGAAALVAASVSTHLMVLDPKVDGALTAMTTLAIACMVTRRPLLGWVLAGCAVLSKGPIGLVIPMLAIGPEWLRRARPFTVKPLLGAPLLLAVIAPFYLAMAKQNGDGAATFLLWNQGIGRLLDSSAWKNDTTPLFFTHTALWAFFPFSLLVVAALGLGARTLFARRTLPSDAKRIVWWWFLGAFAVISLAQFRLPQYVFWLTPPAALIAAESLGAVEDTRWWRAGALALGLGGGGLGAFLLVQCFPTGVVSTGAWLVVLVGAPLVAFVLSGRSAVLAFVGASLGFLAQYHAHLHPALLEYQPGREIAAQLRALAPNDTEVMFVGLEPTQSVAFYAQRDAFSITPEELLPRLARGPLIVVGEANALAKLKALGAEVSIEGHYPTFRTSVPTKAFLLASTRASVLGWVEVARVGPTLN